MKATRPLEIAHRFAVARVAGSLLTATLVTAASPARAADDVEGARTAFVEATELVAKAQWAEALAAFERARERRAHPVTTFNMAACERAMGHYGRARVLFEEALAEHTQGHDGRNLPASLVAEANALIGELDRLLVRLTLTVTTPGSTIAIDGRPLAPRDDVFVAGVLSAGPGTPTPTRPFVVVLDPGLHVLMFARRGFRDASLTRTFSPGQAVSMEVELSRLPATLAIASIPDGAIVTVDGTDVGPAPIALTRAPGTYRVVVRHPGFVSYESQLSLDPGQDATLKATLPREQPSITSHWWFWAGAGALVAGATAATYFLTRPEPTRPEVGGGSIGWRVDVK